MNTLEASQHSPSRVFYCRLYFLLIIAPLLFLPTTFARAAVYISEVAWMGTFTSANDEWIELHNDGSALSLDGWVLTDGENLNIALSGTIQTGAFAVLERTDDTSAQGDAFLIYTGALANDGRTLKLLRADGSIEDQVAGGENWIHIGGDNVTKETAQYTVSGWTTGTPTPGSANSAYTPPAEDDAVSTGDTEGTKPNVIRSSGGSKNEKVQLILPDVTLSLALDAPTLAYVHQPVLFSIEPSGVGKSLLDSLQYRWNFGDLTVASGKEVTHQYEYPGTYVLIVEGEIARQSASIRHEITVLPVTFSITKNTDGDIQVNNDSKYEVDISGYSVRGDTTLVFPDRTILLPNATLTIPKKMIGSTAYAWLFDQEQTIVASTLPSPSIPRTEVLSYVKPPIAPGVAVAPSAEVFEQAETFSFGDTAMRAEDNSDFEITVSEHAPIEKVVQAATVNEAQVPISNNKLPFLGLIGVLSLGILAMYAGRIPK